MRKFSKYLVLLLALVILTTPLFVRAQSTSLEVRQDANLDGVPGQGGGSGSVTGPLSFIEFNVAVQDDYAFFTWRANRKAHYTLAWGLTPDFEYGTAASNINTYSGNYLLEGLQPNTTYYYLLVLNDGFGFEAFKVGTFTTIQQPDTQAPASPLNFIANANQDSISLFWQNPTDSDLAGVRIVKSDRFYPLDPTNGELIFQGQAESFIDTNVVSNQIYYYSIFSFDNSGNYSAPAIAEALILLPPETDQPPTQSPDGQPPSQTPGTPPATPPSIPGQPGSPSQPPTQPTPPSQDDKPIVDIDLRPSDKDERDIRLDDFVFTVLPSNQTVRYRNLQIGSNENLYITIDKNKLQKSASSILLTINSTDGSIAESKYIFKFNKETNQYELQLPNLPVGEYEITIQILDEEFKLMQTLRFNFKVISPEQVPQRDRMTVTNNLWIWFWVLLGLILAVIFWWFLIGKRRKDDKEDRKRTKGA